MARTSVGRVFQRGDVWWLDYSRGGKRFRESSESTKRSNAVSKLKERLAEMGAGTFQGTKADRATLADLKKAVGDDYKASRRASTRRMQLAFRHVEAHFGPECRARDINDAAVTAYRVARQDAGASDSSIQKELAALRRGYRLLNIRPPRIPSIVPKNVREGFFNAAEIDAVVAELPEPLRPVVRFAFYTGWRKSEVLGLTWDRVDFEAGVARLAPDTTKNEEGREFPFKALPPLAELLDTQRADTRALEKERGQIIPWVFHRNGKAVRSIDTAWRTACERVGLKGRLFHDLRRSAVVNLEKAGVPRSVAMSLSGHKTEAIYRRYAIADRSAQREGVEKLARMHAVGTGERTVLPIKEAAAS